MKDATAPAPAPSRIAWARISTAGLLPFVEAGDPRAVAAYRRRLADIRSPELHKVAADALAAAIRRRLDDVVAAVDAKIRTEVGAEAERAHRSGLAEATALKGRHWAHAADLDGSNPRSVRHVCGPMCGGT